jgi:hypothetical protein
MLKDFKLSMLSLRSGFFFSILIIVASVLLAYLDLQFKTKPKNTTKIRKEGKNAVREHINYVLSTTTYPLTTENLDLIFKDKIHELAHIHNIEYYSLEGAIKII